MLDPRRLLIFREVAEQRSFSRAAVVLSLTQPAVSQQIRALEVQLGERLIERGRTTFALTPIGELLYAHANALHERLELTEAQLGETIAGERRLLRIGAFPSILGTLVPTAIAQLNRSVGPLEVSAVQGSTDELVAAVRDGRLHVALCFQDAAQPRREHDGTLRVDLLEEPMLAALGPGHRLTSRRRIRLAELARDPWLLAVRGGLIERACVAAGFEPRIAYLTDDPLAINGLVAADLTVTLTSRMLAGRLTGISTPTLTDSVRRTVYGVTPRIAAHRLTTPFLEAVRAADAVGSAAMRRRAGVTEANPARARRASQLAFGGAGGHRSDSSERGNIGAGLGKRTLWVATAAFARSTSN
jgi:DNA-binding transcriptional LysR family regulator